MLRSTIPLRCCTTAHGQCTIGVESQLDGADTLLTTQQVTVEQSDLMRALYIEYRNTPDVVSVNLSLRMQGKPMTVQELGGRENIDIIRPVSAVP